MKFKYIAILICLSILAGCNKVATEQETEVVNTEQESQITETQIEVTETETEELESEIIETTETELEHESEFIETTETKNETSLTDEEWAEYDAKLEELLNESTETEGNDGSGDLYFETNPDWEGGGDLSKVQF